ncbi:MAG: inositol oxygenase family protein [Paracoccaceae bacterium]|jgi:predicted HD phosphohydrolase|nr:inositol oxygenase family protein [Paracoccaceae bacterium]
MEQVKFTKMEDGDAEDYRFLNDHETEYTKGTADRLLKALVNLDESLSGYQITRLGHSVQSASRAWRDGADIDWVVSALLHDVGDIFAPYNHDEYAATILKPFVREQCRWVVEKHGDFQMIYYGHLVGGNQNKRDKFNGHEFFNDCAEFCERWDQTSFDPSYDDLPLDFFRPMVEEVFAREPYNPDILNAKSMPLFDPEISASRCKK